jgi:hypothetical protein
MALQRRRAEFLRHVAACCSQQRRLSLAAAPPVACSCEQRNSCGPSKEATGLCRGRSSSGERGVRTEEVDAELDAAAGEAWLSSS